MPRKKKKSIAETVIADDAATAKKYVPKYTPVEPSPGDAGSAPEVDPPDPPTPQEYKAQMKAKRDRAKLQKLSTDGDLVDIWERRILNPNSQETLPIRITTPGMKIRWINLSNRGRFQRARYEQGWVPVSQGELVDEREIFGVSYTSEGFVCRGEKQSEMLMKIPAAVYRQIQLRRMELNTNSYKKLRQNMAAAGGNHMKERHGSSAGEQAEELANSFRGSIKFGTEKVSSDELFE